MRMPWIGRAAHAATVAGLEARLASTEADRDYWRSRCERLVDAALLVRREIASPVFEDPKVSADPVRSVFAAGSRVASHLGAPVGVRIHDDAR